MAKRRKKSLNSDSSTLTNEDFELICRILVKTVSRLQAFIDDMKSSERPSKMFFDSTKEKGLAGMFLLFRTNFAQVGVGFPNEINKSMAKNFNQAKLDRDNIILSNVIQKEEFIASKRLSEVLRALKDTEFFLHINDKKKIINILGCKKIELHGTPSFYKIPKQSRKLDKFLSRPEVMSTILKYLIDSKLLQKFIKHVMVGFLGFVREADKTQLYEGMRSVNETNSVQISHIADEYSNIQPILLSLDKSQSETIGEQITEKFIEEIRNSRDYQLLKRILVILNQLKLD